MEEVISKEDLLLYEVHAARVDLAHANLSIVNQSFVIKYKLDITAGDRLDMTAGKIVRAPKPASLDDSTK